MLPFAVKVDELPEQITGGEALAVIVGFGITVMARVLVPVQPVILDPVTV